MKGDFLLLAQIRPGAQSVCVNVLRVRKPEPEAATQIQPWGGIGNVVENRKFARYQLDLPVTFSWKDAAGRSRSGSGVIRDISAGGVFILAGTSPPDGSAIRYETVLPQLEEVFSSLRMEVEGRVLRTEGPPEGKEISGFAAVCENFALQETV